MRNYLVFLAGLLSPYASKVSGIQGSVGVTAVCSAKSTHFIFLRSFRELCYSIYSEWRAQFSFTVNLTRGGGSAKNFRINHTTSWCGSFRRIVVSLDGDVATGCLK